MYICFFRSLIIAAKTVCSFRAIYRIPGRKSPYITDGNAKVAVYRLLAL